MSSFLGLVFLLLVSTTLQAANVASISNSIQLSQPTKDKLAPTGVVSPGDILTFEIPVSSLINGATRGAGEYITVYIPGNTEVVGARFIDSNSNTVTVLNGPYMPDGYGGRGRKNEFDALGLAQGSLAQLYADTGIFYSTDSLTSRVPDTTFITVFNGTEVTPQPTGAGQIESFLGIPGSPYYVHNEWDRIQAIAYGASGGTVISSGNGSTPFGFGSPVAGPETHYSFEKVEVPACSDGTDNDSDSLTDFPADPDCASALDDDETAAASAPTGPWNRIQSAGSETGTGATTDFAGTATRVGIPATFGIALSADNPLPASTNAVRFAIGQLTASQTAFAEISLRVVALPLDPTMGDNVVCSEAFAGDHSAPGGGRDNPWRYVVPSPTCVQLDYALELSVDKALAVNGETLTYTVEGVNLSAFTQTNVVVTDSFDAAAVSFLGATLGPVPTVGAGILTWPAFTLVPGASFKFSWEMQITSAADAIVNQATLESDALPSPGVLAQTYTAANPIVVIAQNATVAPTTTSPGSVVNYTVTLTNTGTASSSLNGGSFIGVTLPTGFSVVNNTSTINAVAVANPTPGSGNTQVFSSGLANIAASGGTMMLSFNVLVDPSVTAGSYTVDLQSQLRDPAINRDIENSSFKIARLLINVATSVPPTLDNPVYAGSSMVYGIVFERSSGGLVNVYVNGTLAGFAITLADDTFAATVPTLFVGQHINATVEYPGEVESALSSPDVIVVPPVIIDTDGDGIPDGTDNCPNDANTAQLDTDNDGMGNVCDTDDDNDGLADTVEDINGNGIVDVGETDPLDSDTDDDGLSDGSEVNVYGTNPLKIDTDDDGLTDSYEVNISNTNPTLPTTLLPGDMNGDGLLGVPDLLLIQRAVLGLP